MKIFLLLICLISTVVVAQDKLNLDYKVYNNWKSIKQTVWSPDGEIIAYQINPFKGDGFLYVKNTSSNKVLSKIERGKNAVIHHDNAYVVYNIGTQYDSIRQLKLDKVKKDKFPKDTLGIYWIKKDSTALIPNVKSFKQSEEGEWLAYLLAKDTRPNCKKKKCKILNKRNKCEKEATTGTTLILYNPLSHQKQEIYQVKEYYFNEKGTILAYVTSNKGEKDSLSLNVLMLNQQNSVKILSKNKLSIKSIAFDKMGNQLAYLESNDTNKRKTYYLNYWHKDLSEAITIVDSLTQNMPQSWTVSEFKAPFFSRNGKKLFLGTNKIVEQEPEDTLLNEEKPKVDVWSWQDKKLQPMQLKQKKFEEKRSYLAVYHINENKFVQLANKKIRSIKLLDHNNSNFALGYDDQPYQKEQSWEFPWSTDLYRIDVNSGKAELLKSKIKYDAELSPSGKYLMWYSGTDSSWKALNVNTKKEINITLSIKANFADDNNGSPYIPYPVGNSRWVNDKDEEKLIVYSEYDIWLLNPNDSNNQICLTGQQGKTNKVKYRVNVLERDSTYLILNNNLFHGFDTRTKEEFYIKPNNISKEFLKTNHTFYFMIKAKKSNKLLFRMMNFQDYPELYITDLNFTTPIQLTQTNPQQKKYNWGTVELVHWTSYEGKQLDGLLYKPENFDSTKKYPMIVYFYEKYADDIHRHYQPKPTASIIYPTEYVSNGYIVFIPDIKYTPGHPAKSAYDCIVSGTDYLIKKYNWIDSTRMGLQGQSWGGYQTAQLITMTDKFTCGMAGAPVSNMFSAYGGVRWGSGMSRAFQYERTQSRIGCTIWDCPELYMENSPIFHLPKVNTPLLIMHNDGDGAVPWYQGIEMYMGLRRLNKPVWLLNYNGDQHNLMKNANREDLSIRMRQFFDYYLQGKPQPKWMSEGVKAIDKGKTHIPE
ncbi:MAG TPA: S9 family peptidase [Crocinitomix sp.]|nr:S9 family peptidase [Crocinitomix sp.]